jgi:predicted DNA binding CopG/RHH family protein
MSKDVSEVPVETPLATDDETDGAVTEEARAARSVSTIRLLPVEHAAFKRAADARGLPMMTWLRCAGRQAAGLDPEGARWSPPREGEVDTPPPADEGAKASRRVLTIRLLPAERAAFKRAADARGLPMMTWLRSAGRRAAGLDPAD